MHLLSEAAEEKKGKERKGKERKDVSQSIGPDSKRIKIDLFSFFIQFSIFPW